MKPKDTKIIKVNPNLSSKDDIDMIAFSANVLKSGGLVAFPTETVYGLGSSALNEIAVKNIFIAKGRPQDNPLILHVSSVDDIEKYCFTEGYSLDKLSDFMPGPLTIILPKREVIPNIVTAGLDNAAIRIPSHPVAVKLIELAGVPIAAPSANRSGSPSPTEVSHVISDLFGKVDIIIDAGKSQVGLESTVITLCTNPPTLLRPGGVSYEQLTSIFGKVNLSDSIFNQMNENEKASSPGMKYKHYSPETPMYLLSGQEKNIRLFLQKKQKLSNCAIMCFEEDFSFFQEKKDKNLLSVGSRKDSETYASRLYSLLRKTDELSVKSVYARVPDENKGISLALYNRLLRASEHKIVNTDEINSNIFIIGLTGPTGAGKGLFCDIAEKMNIFCVNTDDIARQITKPNMPALKELSEIFGESILKDNYSLDRKKLAQIVFSDKNALYNLNKITHKYITKEVLIQINNESQKGRKLIIIDAPVLFESPIAPICDRIIGVLADKNTRLSRVIKRDIIDETEAQRRILAARSDDFFISRCDEIIYNNSNVFEFEEQVVNLCKKLISYSEELERGYNP